jgi:hypothetical protein
MRRHGRTATSDRVGKQEDFDSKLDTAIRKLESMMPNEWQTVMEYIDSCAAVPPGISVVTNSDAYIARHTAQLEGIAKIFFRLSKK